MMARKTPMWLSALSAFALTAAACGDESAGKANPQTSVPKPMDAAQATPGESGEAAKVPPGSRAATAADKVRAANPHLSGPIKPKAAPAASPPKEINFDGKTRRDIVDQLGYTVPSQWTTQTPANRMRLAQYDLPGPGGGASLVLYRFPGGGGSAQQNIDRWVTQFKQPDGSDTKGKLVMAVSEQEPYKVTRVALSGTFDAPPMGPGMKAAGPTPDTRMLAAIVEGDGDPFFFKLIGPSSTVDTWEQAFNEMVSSFKKGA